MKRKTFVYLAIATFLLGFESKAQNNTSNKSDIEIMSGFAFGGPLNQMENYLVTQGYNATHAGFFGSDVNYPLKIESGVSISLGYCWGSKDSKKMGLRLGYSNFGNIVGINDSGQRLDIGFRTITTAVFYQFIHRPIQLRIGPTILFNTAYENDALNESKKTIDSGFALGIFTELNLYIWNSKRTYGTVNCSYSYCTSNKLGPFTTDGFNGPGEIPETGINFKHTVASFTFGVHL